jgi:glycosyltransferase involved in cell wall biosynthesis
VTTRIAFVRMADHPIPNRLLPPHLAKSLSEAEIEIFDVERAVRRDALGMALNPIFVVLENGWNLLRGRVRPWQAFFGTTWMFRRMSQLARHFVERGDFTLSFQIQSIFDARSERVPHFVYTDHTHLANLGYPDFDRRTLRGPRWTALERQLYAGAALVFTRSSNISRSLEADYGCPPEHISCVGAGSNAALPDQNATTQERDGREILFVGVDWERKGGPELLAAFERVRAAHPKARLSIVGCDPRIDAPGVSVFGRLPLEEVSSHYQRASVFCLPTRREPFGVVLIEALQYGLPVVATRVGAVPDLIRDGENGFLVEPGDVEQLTNRLCQLQEDHDRRTEMALVAQQEARAIHTWTAVANRMADAIQQVMAAKPLERSAHAAARSQAPFLRTLEID